jgi:hypothetical protein
VVKVHLWSGLRRFTDGAEVVQVQADTVGQMLDGLVAAHPGLGPVIAAGVSVSIDGVLTASRFGAVSEANEIYLIQRIKGG